jgi:ribonuclease-3
MRPNSSHTGKRRKNRARGAITAPTLTSEQREACQAAIAHNFKSPELLDRAMTHRSAAQGNAVAWSNERLEFLGDRVLGLVIVETLLERFEGVREGDLAPRLNTLVSRDTCAIVGAALGLDNYIIVDRAERAAGGPKKSSLLANAAEAVIGAVYLDAGLGAARKFILRHWKLQMAAVKAAPRDPKSALQEWAQGEGRPTPAYVAEARTGPDHAPVFTASVEVEGWPKTIGAGPSKQEAERAAAKALLAIVAAGGTDDVGGDEE